jgi:hypothetical protein
MSLDTTEETSRPTYGAWEMTRRSCVARECLVRSAIWPDGCAEERPKPRFAHGECCETDAASV